MLWPHGPPAFNEGTGLGSACSMAPDLRGRPAGGWAARIGEQIDCINGCLPAELAAAPHMPASCLWSGEEQVLPCEGEEWAV